jgi:hypothetical protein
MALHRLAPDKAEGSFAALKTVKKSRYAIARAVPGMARSRWQLPEAPA